MAIWAKSTAPLEWVSNRREDCPMRKFALLALTSVLAVVCLAQGDRVPAYHDHALQPGDAMPILPKDQWWGESFQYPYQVKSYELAAKIPSVLYQMRSEDGGVGKEDR